MLEANSSLFISSGKMSPYMPCLEILFNCVERIPCILSSVRRPLAIETRFLGLGPHIRAASTSVFGFSGVISSLSLCKNYLDEYDDVFTYPRLRSSSSIHTSITYTSASLSFTHAFQRLRRGELAWIRYTLSSGAITNATEGPENVPLELDRAQT